jgi:hypothetical protein
VRGCVCVSVCGAVNVGSKHRSGLFYAKIVNPLLWINRMCECEGVTKFRARDEEELVNEGLGRRHIKYIDIDTGVVALGGCLRCEYSLICKVYFHS